MSAGEYAVRLSRNAGEGFAIGRRSAVSIRMRCSVKLGFRKRR